MIRTSTSSMTMTRMRALWQRMRKVFGSSAGDRELQEEWATHLEMQIAANIRAGMEPAAAARAARIKLGNPVAAADAYRDRRGLPFVDALRRDTRYAWRALWKSPGFAVSSVLVLSLGIGTSIAVATVLQAVAWNPLPVQEPERVVKLSVELSGDFDRNVSGNVTWFSYPELKTYQRLTRTLSGVAASRGADVTLSQAGRPVGIAAALVTGNYFDVLDVRAASGRMLGEADVREPVAVLSHRAWRQRFNADPSVLGAPLLIDRQPYVVIGVAERQFTGTDLTFPDVWLPLEAYVTASGHADLLTAENNSWVEPIGRLAHGASIDVARAEAAQIAAAINEPYPARRTTISVISASRVSAGLSAHPSGRAKIALAISTGSLAMLLVLLICTSNAAGLLLARGIARQREIAVRVALGASRAHLVAQLLTESAMLAITAAALGLLLSTWLLRAAAHQLPIGEILESITPAAPVLAFTLLVTIVTTLLCGVAPARAATTISALPALRSEGAGVSPSKTSARLRNAILTAQVAVSVALLVAAALLTRGVLRASSVDAGIRIQDTYMIRADVGRQGYDRTRADLFVSELRQRLRASAVVAHVGVTSVPPFNGRGLTFAGSDPQSLRQVQFNVADQGYFDVLKIPVAAGRVFDERDTSRSVVVNEAFARWLWPSETSVIGRTFWFRSDEGMQTADVIGVVRTVQSVQVGAPDNPTFYRPLDRRSRPGGTVVLQSASRDIGQVVTQTIRALDPQLLFTTRALADEIERQTGPARVGAAAAGFFGVLALLIAAVGIHGLVAYAVAQRTREIGVHLALGATSRNVIRLVLASTLRPIVVGALVGVVVATIGARLASQLLLGTSALDPLAMAAVLSLLIAVTVGAAYAPARRALNVDPIAALRYE